MFKDHKEFEVAFKAGINPKWFPVKILWNYVSTGDEITGTLALHEWLSNQASGKPPQELTKVNGSGGGAFVKTKSKLGLAFKIFRNSGGGTVTSFRNVVPMRNCLVELANYFVFKTFIPPQFLPVVKTLFFKVDLEIGYQVGYVMEFLQPWNVSSRFETIANFFDVQEVLAKRGVTLVHGDLKHDNIMVHPKTKDLKIIDFGLSMYHITFEDDDVRSIFNTGYNHKFIAPDCRHVDLLLFSKAINSPEPKAPGFYHDYIYNMPTFGPFNWRQSKNSVLRLLLAHEDEDDVNEKRNYCCFELLNW